MALKNSEKYQGLLYWYFGGVPVIEKNILWESPENDIQYQIIFIHIPASTQWVL